MKRRTMGLGLVTGFAVLAGALVVGCSSEGGGGGGGEVERGTLSFPLLTEGASGTKYRLRDATFEIRNEDYYYYDTYSAGGGGADGGPGVLTISSEDDPDAASISVSVERGYKYIRLLPGWHMEKVEGGLATPVEATLLSESSQWVYVGAHSTSWVSYEFGLGERSLWFNGKLNVNIQVYENPSEIYGDGVGGQSDGVGGQSDGVGGHGG